MYYQQISCKAWVLHTPLLMFTCVKLIIIIQGLLLQSQDKQPGSALACALPAAS